MAAAKVASGCSAMPTRAARRGARGRASRGTSRLPAVRRRAGRLLRSRCASATTTADMPQAGQQRRVAGERGRGQRPFVGNARGVAVAGVVVAMRSHLPSADRLRAVRVGGSTGDMPGGLRRVRPPGRPAARGTARARRLCGHSRCAAPGQIRRPQRRGQGSPTRSRRPAPRGASRRAWARREQHPRGPPDRLRSTPAPSDHPRARCMQTRAAERAGATAIPSRAAAPHGPGATRAASYTPGRTGRSARGVWPSHQLVRCSRLHAASSRMI